MTRKAAERSLLTRVLVSAPEAAELLGIGESLFRDEVLPKLPRVELGTRVLFDVEDLRTWVAAHKVIPSAEPEPVGRTQSGSGSKGSGESSPRVLEIERELKQKLDASTRKRSAVGASVHELHPSDSQQGAQRNG